MSAVCIRARGMEVTEETCAELVLAIEGGFYTDLDLELKVPLHELVDSGTTFMSASTAEGALWNAIIAVVPGSPIMKQAMEEIKLWKRGEFYPDGTPIQSLVETSEWMGPATLFRGLQSLMRSSCPDVSSDHLSQERGQLDWSCGPGERLRLYQEKPLVCSGSLVREEASGAHGRSEQEEECPEARRSSRFDGARYGLFVPGPARKIVGWDRFEDCNAFGCSAGGWDVS